MDKKEATVFIKELTDELNHQSYLYYQKDTSLISDYEFDQRLKLLEKIEEEYPDLKLPYSPTLRVGGDIIKEFQAVVHQYPMLSLGNTYSMKELSQFDERIIKILSSQDYEYICELKYDGIAISLIYEDGYLLRAVTRGDGIKGDDVTSNIKTIKTIPLSVKTQEKFEVRGEIILPKSVFYKLNEARVKENLPPLANPRNTVSGTIKMQDSKIVASRDLDCFIYHLEENFMNIKTHEKSLLWLKEEGFNVSPYYQKCNNPDQVFTFIDHWENKRKQLDVETDGIVLKINNFEHRRLLGNTAKNPRWAISYKYSTDSRSTLLKNITYQVGRTGVITPVAHFKPVHISGTSVKRASLHNANEIKKLDLHYSDTVWVEKGGEIIPKITGVDISKRKENAMHIEFITHCLECGTELIKYEDEALYYCPNSSKCPPQILGKIEHFISRDAMDIRALGAKTVKGLLACNLVRSCADLYDLNLDQLNGLTLTIDSDTKRSLQEKSATKIIQAIDKSKIISFPRVLFALGIRHVGKNIAKKIAAHYQTMDNLKKTSFGELMEIEEIGVKIAESIIVFFQDSNNKTLLKRLQAKGLKFELEQYSSEQVVSNVLKDMTFVISGVFHEMERNDLKKLIENEGGEIKGSISKKTNYLLVGENPGGSKLEKANELGISILKEIQFFNLLKASKK